MKWSQKFRGKLHMSGAFFLPKKGRNSFTRVQSFWQQVGLLKRWGSSYPQLLPNVAKEVNIQL